MAQISHDLRTPLNAVIGFSDVMSAEMLGPVGNPRYREYAGDIGHSGRKLLKAAEDTLALTALIASTPRGAPERLSICALMADIFDFFSIDAASRGISLVCDTDNADFDIAVLALKHPLRQAMLNLVSEAMARARDGATLSLRAVAEDDTVRLELGVSETNNRPREPGSLSMSLARALLEMQGAGLIELPGHDGSWRTATVLDLAVQGDFFTAPSFAASRRSTVQSESMSV
jgi:two-component system cell cycle sensor histidine kinase PleC